MRRPESPRTALRHGRDPGLTETPRDVVFRLLVVGSREDLLRGHCENYVAEVERQLSINEDVLRWLTVRVEELDLELSPLLARRERERERERERTPRDDAAAEATF